MPCSVEKFLQQPGYGPQAARRRRAGELRSPRRLRRRACGPPAPPRKPCPHRAQQFSVCFYRKVFAFCGLCFFADLALFAAGTERIARPPQGKAIGSFLATIAACRFWAFAVGKNSSHPRKGKPMDRFYPPSPPVDFGRLRRGRIVPIPARKNDWIVFSHHCRLSILRVAVGKKRWFPSPARASQWVVFIHPRRLSILGFAVGKNSPYPCKGKANGWFFYPLSPGSANCGVKSSPSRRRASSRAGCGGRAVK